MARRRILPMGRRDTCRSTRGSAATLRRTAAIVLAVLAALPAAWAAGPPRGVVVIQGVEPEGLDASITSGLYALNPALHVLEPLVDFDDHLRVVPKLATSWKWIDPTTLEMTLRRGVSFQDGQPFTSEDVKYTFERILDPKNRSDFRRYFSERVVKAVQAPNDATVRFVLAEARPVFVRTLTQVGIVSEKAVRQMGAARFTRAPVGTGPYQVREWTAGVRITMSANARYWGGIPAVRDVEWRWVTEDATRVASLVSGNADLITGLPPELIKRVDGSPVARSETVPSLRTVFIVMNTKKPPFSDVRIRRALNYGVNVQSIITNVLGGFADRVPSVVGPDVFGYNPALRLYPFDPERAKQLLTEAGYPRGFAATFWAFRGRLLKDDELSEAITAHLQRIGVNVTLRFLDFEAVFDAIRKYNREPDLLLWSNANNNGDASYNLELNFWSQGRATYWSDPQVDALIADAGREINDQRRRGLYQQALRLITDTYVPDIFLYDEKDLYGVSRRLEWRPRPDERIELWQARTR